MSAFLAAWLAVSEQLSASGTASACPQGHVVNVIAHADDDLYFMNPDIAAALDAGQCLTTVVVTGGYVDDTDNTPRVNGLKAAYAQMAMQADDWQQSWQMQDGRPLERFQLRGRPGVGLVFFHLPCGGHDHLGSKTGTPLHEVLQGKETRSIGVKAGARWTRDSIADSLRQIIATLGATRVNTLDPDVPVPVTHNSPQGEGSHPDHAAVAQLTRDAVAGLAMTQKTVPPIWAYLDYPQQEKPRNLNPADAKAKHQSMAVYCLSDVRACNHEAMKVVDCPAEVFWGEAWLCRRYARALPLKRP